MKIVVNDWIKVSVMSHDRNSGNNSMVDACSSDLLKNKSYWGLCDLIAAGL